MDVKMLADSAVALLLPYLALAAEEAAKKLGEDLYGKAKSLHELVRDKITGDKTAEDALANLEDEPTNQIWQNGFLAIMIMKLKANPGFARQVEQIVEETKKLPDTKVIEQYLTVTGTVTGGVFQVGEGSITYKDS